MLSYLVHGKLAGAVNLIPFQVREFFEKVEIVSVLSSAASGCGERENPTSGPRVDVAPVSSAQLTSAVSKGKPPAFRQRSREVASVGGSSLGIVADTPVAPVKISTASSEASVSSNLKQKSSVVSHAHFC